MKRPRPAPLLSWELWEEPSGQYLLREAGEAAPAPASGSRLLATLAASDLRTARAARDRYLGYGQDPRDGDVRM